MERMQCFASEAFMFCVLFGAYMLLMATVLAVADFVYVLASALVAAKGVP